MHGGRQEGARRRGGADAALPPQRRRLSRPDPARLTRAWRPGPRDTGFIRGNRSRGDGHSAERLYKKDFYARTRDQAAALRHPADHLWNGPLDLLHLAEEVEDLGTAARNTVRSQSERIIEHALRLVCSAAPEPRAGWMNFIDDARGRIEDAIIATIRRDIKTYLPRLFERARRKVVRELAAHDEHDAAAAFPETGPYTLADLLAEDWYPETGTACASHAEHLGRATV
ncbi:MAG TPA: DUF29 domain-containing protein [Geminicoccaceae bacterium]|nr:DUF29 domain-containing protein [Geminicoccaceae bacterium]